MVIPCKCAVKSKPKVLVCPNLRVRNPFREHRWTLLCLTSNGKMLALWGAEEHTPPVSPIGCSLKITAEADTT